MERIMSSQSQSQCREEGLYRRQVAEQGLSLNLQILEGNTALLKDLHNG
jgi:hypothetical protein